MRNATIAFALLAAPPALALLAAPAPQAANPNAPAPPANAPPAPIVGSDEPLPDPRLEAQAQSIIGGLGASASAEKRGEVRARLARGETPTMVRDAVAPKDAVAVAPQPEPVASARPNWTLPLLFVAAFGAIAAFLFTRRKPKAVPPRP